MSDSISRRTFVTTGAAGVASLALAADADAKSKRRKKPKKKPRVTKENRSAVIIGSGFGGSVTALRLAQAGVSSVVLERGMRWPTGPNAETFPHAFRADKRAAWFRRTPAISKTELGFWDPYAGVVERIEGNGIDVVCGSAVGGSSITYHAVTLQPPPDLFQQVMPAGIDYEQMDKVFYPRVAKMQKLQRVPDDILNHERYRTSKTFLQDAQQAGLYAERLPMAVNWDDVRRELNGEVKPSMSNGDCIYGVNNSGKNSVDTTYLAAAEATGKVDVRPLHWVKDISLAKGGGYVVSVDHITPEGALIERKQITTKALFMAAGSANTTKLLVRAKAVGTLPGLPDDIGKYWGNNGDRVYARLTVPGVKTNAFQGGPACVAILDLKNPAGPIGLINGGLPWPDLGATSIIAMAIPDNHGTWTYQQAKDAAVLNWPGELEIKSKKLSDDRLAQLIASSGGITLDTTFIDGVTYHPLGGAVMNKVTDGYGRVLGHPGLYINDGALIPGSTGCVNPSMTIAALAERNISKIVAKDFKRTKKV